MRRYSDKNGGIVVEKNDTKDTSDVIIKKISNKNSVISAKDAIDTIQSYQVSIFSVNDSSDKGICKICGKITAFSNRHVCVDCWKKYKNEIIDGLKTAVKDVEIKID